MVKSETDIQSLGKDVRHAKPKTTKLDRALEGSNWKKRHDITKTNEVGELSRKHVKAVRAALQDTETGYITRKGKDDVVLQKDLKSNLSAALRKQLLPVPRDSKLGHYNVKLSMNGRHMFIGGAKGSMELFDLHNQADRTGADKLTIKRPSGMRSLWKANVCQTIRDVEFLRSHKMVAVAQKEAVNIYDENGINLHRLTGIGVVNHVAYLPHHFLLATAGYNGKLNYLDVSVGKVISKPINITQYQEALSLKVNPWNAVVTAGLKNGMLKMFTPHEPDPVAQIGVKLGPICSIDFSLDGKYMAVAGSVGGVKVYDIRNTFNELSNTKMTAGSVRCVSISQRDHLAVGGATGVKVWENLGHKSRILGSPVLTHKIERRFGEVHNCVFRPFEDILYTGCQGGVVPMVVPGAGFATLDTAGPYNPYMGNNQAKNQLIQQLLDKLPSESIVLNPDMLGAYRAKAGARVKPIRDQNSDEPSPSSEEQEEEEEEQEQNE